MVENGTGPSSAAERGVNGTRRDEDAAEAGNENENEDNENNENDEEEEEDDDEDDDDDHEGPYTPFDLPSKELLRLLLRKLRVAGLLARSEGQMCPC